MYFKPAFLRNGAFKQAVAYVVCVVLGVMIWALTYGQQLKTAVAEVNQAVVLNAVELKTHHDKLSTIEDRLLNLADKDDINALRADVRALMKDNGGGN